MTLREASVIHVTKGITYVTEPWDRGVAARQNAVDSDASLLAAADFAQDPDLQYITGSEARFIQDPDTGARGKILGITKAPLPPENVSSLIAHSQKISGELRVHRVRRFAVVAWQDFENQSGVIRFIPIRDLPKNQDAGSFKALRFSSVVATIKHAGGSTKAISQALQQIPISRTTSARREWEKRGGHPDRKGAMKRRKASYRFGL